MGAVALREERQALTIDSPLAVADLCSEMRFLDRECLRVVLLNAKQHLIKVCTVSQGSVNESLAHPREVFKPAIIHPAYSFIMVHNHPSGDPSPSEADLRLTRRILEASRILLLQLVDHVIIGAPAPGRSGYFSFKEGGVISLDRLTSCPLQAGSCFLHSGKSSRVLHRCSVLPQVGL